LRHLHTCLSRQLILSGSHQRKEEAYRIQTLPLYRESARLFSSTSDFVIPSAHSLPYASTTESFIIDAIPESSWLCTICRFESLDYGISPATAMISAPSNVLCLAVITRISQDAMIATSYPGLHASMLTTRWADPAE